MDADKLEILAAIMYGQLKRNDPFETFIPWSAQNPDIRNDWRQVAAKMFDEGREQYAKGYKP